MPHTSIKENSQVARLRFFGLFENLTCLVQACNLFCSEQPLLADLVATTGVDHAIIRTVLSEIIQRLHVKLVDATEFVVLAGCQDCTIIQSLIDKLLPEEGFANDSDPMSRMQLLILVTRAMRQQQVHNNININTFLSAVATSLANYLNIYTVANLKISLKEELSRVNLLRQLAYLLFELKCLDKGIVRQCLGMQLLAQLKVCSKTNNNLLLWSELSQIVDLVCSHDRISNNDSSYIDYEFNLTINIKNEDSLDLANRVSDSLRLPPAIVLLQISNSSTTAKELLVLIAESLNKKIDVKKLRDSFHNEIANLLNQESDAINLSHVLSMSELLSFVCSLLSDRLMFIRYGTVADYDTFKSSKFSKAYITALVKVFQDNQIGNDEFIKYLRIHYFANLRIVASCLEKDKYSIKSKLKKSLSPDKYSLFKNEIESSGEKFVRVWRKNQKELSKKIEKHYKSSLKKHHAAINWKYTKKLTRSKSDLLIVLKIWQAIFSKDQTAAVEIPRKAFHTFLLFKQMESIRINKGYDELLQKSYITPTVTTKSGANNTKKVYSLAVLIEKVLQPNDRTDTANLYIFKGSIGSGKTTFYYYLQSYYERKYRLGQPLLVSLNDMTSFNSESKDPLGDYLLNQGYEPSLVTHLKRSDIYFLLDTDIVDPNKFESIFQFSHSLESGWDQDKIKKIFIVCDDNIESSNFKFSFDLGKKQIYNLQGFSNEQIESYLQKCQELAEQANSLYPEDDVTSYMNLLYRLPGLKEFATNPLLLSLIILGFRCLEQAKVSWYIVVDIFDAVFDVLLDSANQDMKSIGESDNFLKKIMRKVISAASSGHVAFDLDEWEYYPLKPILVKIEADKYEFTHKLIFEYILARALWDQLKLSSSHRKDEFETNLKELHKQYFLKAVDSREPTPVIDFTQPAMLTDYYPNVLPFIGLKVQQDRRDFYKSCVSAKLISAINTDNEQWPNYVYIWMISIWNHAGMSLSGMDLTKKSLSGADLRDAILDAANFDETDLGRVLTGGSYYSAGCYEATEQTNALKRLVGYHGYADDVVITKAYLTLYQGRSCLIVCQSDGQIRISLVYEKAPLYSFSFDNPKDKYIQILANAKNKNLFAFTATKAIIWEDCFDPTQYTKPNHIALGNNKQIVAVDVSQDGRYLLIALQNGLVFIREGVCFEKVVATKSFGDGLKQVQFIQSVGSDSNRPNVMLIMVTGEEAISFWEYSVPKMLASHSIAKNAKISIHADTVQKRYLLCVVDCAKIELFNCKFDDTDKNLLIAPIKKFYFQDINEIKKYKLTSVTHCELTESLDWLAVACVFEEQGHKKYKLLLFELLEKQIEPPGILTTSSFEIKYLSPILTSTYPVIYLCFDVGNGKFSPRLTLVSQHDLLVWSLDSLRIYNEHGRMTEHKPYWLLQLHTRLTNLKNSHCFTEKSLLKFPTMNSAITTTLELSTNTENERAVGELKHLYLNSTLTLGQNIELKLLENYKVYIKNCDFRSIKLRISEEAIAYASKSNFLESKIRITQSGQAIMENVDLSKANIKIKDNGVFIARNNIMTEATLVVSDGGKFTMNNTDLNKVAIDIKDNGELVVSESVIMDATLVVSGGGKLTMRDVNLSKASIRIESKGQISIFNSIASDATIEHEKIAGENSSIAIVGARSGELEALLFISECDLTKANLKLNGKSLIEYSQLDSANLKVGSDGNVEVKGGSLANTNMKITGTLRLNNINSSSPYIKIKQGGVLLNVESSVVSGSQLPGVVNSQVLDERAENSVSEDKIKENFIQKLKQSSFDSSCISDYEKYIRRSRAYQQIWEVGKNNSTPRIIVLHGFPGSGKTSLLKVLAKDWLGEKQNDTNHAIFWFKVNSQFDLNNELQDYNTNTKFLMENPAQILATEIENNTHLLTVFDSVYFHSDLFDLFHKVSGVLILVVDGVIEDPYRKTVKYIEVGCMQKNDAEMLLYEELNISENSKEAKKLVELIGLDPQSLIDCLTYLKSERSTNHVASLEHLFNHFHENNINNFFKTSRKCIRKLFQAMQPNMLALFNIFSLLNNKRIPYQLLEICFEFLNIDERELAKSLKLLVDKKIISKQESGCYYSLPKFFHLLSKSQLQYLNQKDYSFDKLQDLVAQSLLVLHQKLSFNAGLKDMRCYLQHLNYFLKEFAVDNCKIDTPKRQLSRICLLTVKSMVLSSEKDCTAKEYYDKAFDELVSVVTKVGHEVLRWLTIRLLNTGLTYGFISEASMEAGQNDIRINKIVGVLEQLYKLNTKFKYTKDKFPKIKFSKVNIITLILVYLHQSSRDSEQIINALFNLSLEYYKQRKTDKQQGVLSYLRLGLEYFHSPLHPRSAIYLLYYYLSQKNNNSEELAIPFRKSQYVLQNLNQEIFPKNLLGIISNLPCISNIKDYKQIDILGRYATQSINFEQSLLRDFNCCTDNLERLEKELKNSTNINVSPLLEMFLTKLRLIVQHDNLERPPSCYICYHEADSEFLNVITETLLNMGFNVASNTKKELKKIAELSQFCSASILGSDLLLLIASPAWIHSLEQGEQKAYVENEQLKVKFARNPSAVFVLHNDLKEDCIPEYLLKHTSIYDFQLLRIGTDLTNSPFIALNFQSCNFLKMLTDILTRKFFNSAENTLMILRTVAELSGYVKNTLVKFYSKYWMHNNAFHKLVMNVLHNEGVDTKTKSTILEIMIVLPSVEFLDQNSINKVVEYTKGLIRASNKDLNIRIQAARVLRKFNNDAANEIAQFIQLSNHVLNSGDTNQIIDNGDNNKSIIPMLLQYVLSSDQLKVSNGDFLIRALGTNNSELKSIVATIIVKLYMNIESEQKNSSDSSNHKTIVADLINKLDERLMNLYSSSTEDVNLRERVLQVFELAERSVPRVMDWLYKIWIATTEEDPSILRNVIIFTVAKPKIAKESIAKAQKVNNIISEPYKELSLKLVRCLNFELTILDSSELKILDKRKIALALLELKYFTQTVLEAMFTLDPNDYYDISEQLVRVLTDCINGRQGSDLIESFVEIQPNNEPFLFVIFKKCQSQLVRKNILTLVGEATHANNIRNADMLESTVIKILKFAANEKYNDIRLESIKCLGTIPYRKHDEGICKLFQEARYDLDSKITLATERSLYQIGTNPDTNKNYYDRDLSYLAVSEPDKKQFYKDSPLTRLSLTDVRLSLDNQNASVLYAFGLVPFEMKLKENKLFANIKNYYNDFASNTKFKIGVLCAANIAYSKTRILTDIYHDKDLKYNCKIWIDQNRGLFNQLVRLASDFGMDIFLKRVYHANIQSVSSFDLEVKEIDKNRTVFKILFGLIIEKYSRVLIVFNHLKLNESSKQVENSKLLELLLSILNEAYNDSQLQNFVHCIVNLKCENYKTKQEVPIALFPAPGNILSFKKKKEFLTEWLSENTSKSFFKKNKSLLDEIYLYYNQHDLTVRQALIFFFNKNITWLNFQEQCDLGYIEFQKKADIFDCWTFRVMFLYANILYHFQPNEREASWILLVCSLFNYCELSESVLSRMLLDTEAKVKGLYSREKALAIDEQESSQNKIKDILLEYEKYNFLSWDKEKKLIRLHEHTKLYMMKVLFHNKLIAESARSQSKLKAIFETIMSLISKQPDPIEWDLEHFFNIASTVLTRELDYNLGEENIDLILQHSIELLNTMDSELVRGLKLNTIQIKKFYYTLSKTFYDMTHSHLIKKSGFTSEHSLELAIKLSYMVCPSRKDSIQFKDKTVNSDSNEETKKYMFYARLLLARVYAKKQQFIVALAEYNGLMQKSKEYEGLFSKLTREKAEIYLFNFQYEKALSCYNDVVDFQKDDSKNIEMTNNRVLIFCLKKKFDAATRELKNFSPLLDADNKIVAQYHINLFNALIYDLRNEPEQALVQLAEVQKLVKSPLLESEYQILFLLHEFQHFEIQRKFNTSLILLEKLYAYLPKIKQSIIFLNILKIRMFCYRDCSSDPESLFVEKKRNPSILFYFHRRLELVSDIFGIFSPEALYCHLVLAHGYSKKGKQEAMLYHRDCAIGIFVEIYNTLETSEDKKRLLKLEKKQSQSDGSALIISMYKMMLCITPRNLNLKALPPYRIFQQFYRNGKRFNDCLPQTYHSKFYNDFESDERDESAQHDEQLRNYMSPLNLLGFRRTQSLPQLCQAPSNNPVRKHSKTLPGKPLICERQSHDGNGCKSSNFI